MSCEITGIGSYIPTVVKKNNDFLSDVFLNADGVEIESPNEKIISKFVDITGVSERRYASQNNSTSDLAFFASKKAIENANINPEELDYIILAHNFGDVSDTGMPINIFPSLASRVKHLLQIKNPNCIAYDILFGCPGWLEGVIQAQAFIKAGMAKKILVVGADTLSRVIDSYDRDKMIFADGAGACVIEYKESSTSGILSFASQTFTKEEAFYLSYDMSYDKDADPNVKYMKMNGRKIYEFALKHVPEAMKFVVEKSGVDVSDIKKIFLHQANEKMDEAIVKRFYKQYQKPVPEYVMPMSIHKLGNSSVATIPTLFDLVLKGEIENQEVKAGDVVVFASVGAGMNINAVVYRV